VAAAALAALRSASVIRRREYVALVSLSLSVLAQLLLAVALWGAGRKRGAERGGAVGVIAAVCAALLPVHGFMGAFMYVKEFVRAGESVFGADVLLRVLGFLCGAALTALACAAVRATASRAGVRVARGALTAGLAVSVVSQSGALLQTLMSRRIIPITDILFGFVTFSVNRGDWFLYAAMAVSIVPGVVVAIRRPPPDDSFRNPAQRRLALAALRSGRRWFAVGLACAVTAALSVSVLRTLDEREVTLSPAEPMDIVGGLVTIPLERVGDGHLHRFAYDAPDGTQVRFIVIKKNDVSYGVGLDACEICGPTGYYERDDEVVCKLCDVVMNKSTIGFKGGCNPVPLDFRIEGGAMLIDTRNLDDESVRFK
jgi:uncharacterized membrane protein